MLILLDTCALLWLATAPERLSARVRTIIEDRSSVLFVSTASAWEIGIKWQQGRLDLQNTPRAFLTEALSAYSLTALPVRFEHALAGADLPQHHKDPFDRMLIAQGIVERVPIASPDGHFAKYPVETVW